MTALYVTSLAEGAGKTTICAGLAKHLLSSGKKVGFFKPIVADIKSPLEAIDHDAAFIRHILALEEPVENLCPVISDHNTLANSIKEAYAKVSKGKDVVIVEGVWRQRPGGKPIEACYEIVAALDAKVIIVEGYSGELSTAKHINTYKDFGEYLLGVVLNKVPPSRLDSVSTDSQFSEAGINILGVLPEDRMLFALSVGELAEHLQGEILNSMEKSAELVENFMLGAMTVDPGPEYFGRKANKAVVVKGERPDMQMAALETSTRCLILSGNTAPIPAVQYRAKDKNVPLIAVKSDTMATVMAIEKALDKTRFNQVKKLTKLTEIMEKHFNFQTVYQGLVWMALLS